MRTNLGKVPVPTASPSKSLSDGTAPISRLQRGGASRMARPSVLTVNDQGQSPLVCVSLATSWVEVPRSRRRRNSTNPAAAKRITTPAPIMTAAVAWWPREEVVVASGPGCQIAIRRAQPPWPVLLGQRISGVQVKDAPQCGYRGRVVVVPVEVHRLGVGSVNGAARGRDACRGERGVDVVDRAQEVVACAIEPV